MIAMFGKLFAMSMSVMLTVLGLVFVFLEFFLPGGLTAIFGGALIVLGVTRLLLLPLGFLSKLAYLVGICGLIAGVCCLALYIIRRRGGESLFLSKSQEGFMAASIEPLPLGAKGRAISDLKPSGFVRIDGERFQAVSEGVYVKKGTPVLVKGGRGGYLIVSTHKKERGYVDHS